MTHTETKIKALVETRAGQTVAHLNQSLRGDLGLGSLDMIELICDIEDGFGIDFDRPGRYMHKVKTVRDLAAKTDEILTAERH